MFIGEVLVFLMVSLTAVVLSAQAPDPDALVTSVETATDSNGNISTGRIVTGVLAGLLTMLNVPGGTLRRTWFTAITVLSRSGERCTTLCVSSPWIPA